MPPTRDPWYRITPEKQLNDLRLRRLCKENARALYYDGRHLMHCYGQPYGHLALQPGTPMTPQEIGDLLFMAADTVASALVELCKSGLWQRNPAGVPFDPDLIGTMEEVERHRRNGGLGGNPKFKKSPPLPASTPGSHAAQPPVEPPLAKPAQPPVEPSLTLSLSSLSPSLSQKEREREEREETPSAKGGPSNLVFLAAFAGEDIAAEYLREKWDWFEGHAKWLDASGQVKNYRVLVRGWWRKDRAKWEAAHRSIETLETSAAIEAQLKIEKNPDRRKELLARLKELAA